MAGLLFYTFFIISFYRKWLERFNLWHTTVLRGLFHTLFNSHGQYCPFNLTGRSQLGWSFRTTRQKQFNWSSFWGLLESFGKFRTRFLHRYLLVVSQLKCPAHEGARRRTGWWIEWASCRWCHGPIGPVFQDQKCWKCWQRKNQWMIRSIPN